MTSPSGWGDRVRAGSPNVDLWCGQMIPSPSGPTPEPRIPRSRLHPPRSAGSDASDRDDAGCARGHRPATARGKRCDRRVRAMNGDQASSGSFEVLRADRAREVRSGSFPGRTPRIVPASSELKPGSCGRRMTGSENEDGSAEPSYDARVLTPEILGRTFAEAPDPELARVAFSRVGEDAARARGPGQAGGPSGRLTVARLLDGGERSPGPSPRRGRCAGRCPRQDRRGARPRARGRLPRDTAPPPGSGGSAGGRCSASPPATSPARPSRRSSPRSATWPTRASRTRAPTATRSSRWASSAARELNYASDVDLLLLHREDVGGDIAETTAANLIADLSDPTSEGVALRVDLTLRPGGRAGPLARSLPATLAYYEREAATWERQAMIKARAAAGDRELGEAFVDGVAGFVYPRGPARGRDPRRPAFEGSARGVHAAPRQGAHRGEARPRRHPRRRVRGAAPPDRPRPAGPAAARAQHPPRARHAGGGGVRGRGGCGRARRRLPVPAPAGAPAADGARPPDPRPPGGPARAHHVGALAGSRRRRRRCRPSTTGRRSSFEGSTSASSTGRCSRRSPARSSPTPGHDREATEELLAGLGFAQPSRAFESLQRLVAPSTRIGKVLAHVFPVMAPALALAAEPDAALVRLERIAEAVGDRIGARRRARRRSASGSATRAPRRRELVRDRPAGRRAGPDPRALRQPLRRARRRLPGEARRGGRADRGVASSRPARPVRRSRPSPIR